MNKEQELPIISEEILTNTLEQYLLKNKKQKFEAGDFITFQIGQKHHHTRISEEKYKNFYEMTPMIYAIVVGYSQNTNKKHTLHIVPYFNFQKREINHIYHFIEDDNIAHILDHWKKRPSFKQLLQSRRKAITETI